VGAEGLRRDFPIFSKRKFVYFDNACTTQKPTAVLDAVNAYYTEYTGCAGRSQHHIGKKTEEEFEKARGKVAGLVGAKPNETVWTRNTTEAINLVACSLDFSKRNKVVTSVMEHHSAFLPFQQLKKRGKISLDIVYPDKQGVFEDGAWQEKIDSKTRLVVVHHTTNTLGTSAPLREIVKTAHDCGALVLVDAAQGVPHHEVNFGREGYDFMAFSGQKMLGPTGIGCLVARRELLEEMPPFMVGGETVERVTIDDAVFLKPPHKFEAGLQHYAGAIGLGAAADYLKRQGLNNINRHEKELAKFLFEELKQIKGVKLFGPADSSKTCGIATFNVEKAKNPHEVALMLDNLAGICTRSGVFCAEPAMTWLGAPRGAVRASLYLYNTMAEAEAFVATLKKIAATY